MNFACKMKALNNILVQLEFLNVVSVQGLQEEEELVWVLGFFFGWLVDWFLVGCFWILYKSQ